MVNFRQNLYNLLYIRVIVDNVKIYDSRRFKTQKLQIRFKLHKFLYVYISCHRFT